MCVFLVFGGLFVFECVVYMIVLGGVCLVWVFGDWLFGVVLGLVISLTL